MSSYATAMMKMVLAITGLALATPVFAKEGAVLVVPIHGKAGQQFDASVGKLIEKPLKRHASVIPTAAAKAASRKTHIRPAALKVSKNVQKLGKAAGAAYVLVIEATGRKPHLAANTTLVDVKTGRTLFSDRYAMTGGKLTAEVAAQIVSPVMDKLSGGGSDAGSDSSDPADAPAKATRGGEKSKSDGTAGDPTESPNDNDAAPADAAAASADSSEGAGSESAAAAGERGPRYRPWFRLYAGAEIRQRDARIAGTAPAASPAAVPPCYCGSGKTSNPYFPAGTLGAEFYPFAYNGNGESVVEGLGIQVEFMLTEVKTYVSGTNPNATVGSTLARVTVGPTFRYVWWASPRAIETNVNVGYFVSSFPLSSGVFPGVQYHAAYIGLSARIPLGMEQLSLVADGKLLPGLGIGDTAGVVLGKETSGLGGNIEGGLRFTLDHFEANAMLRYETYHAAFAGPTTFAGTVPQFTSPALNEHLLVFVLTAGVVF